MSAETQGLILVSQSQCISQPRQGTLDPIKHGLSYVWTLLISQLPPFNLNPHQQEAVRECFLKKEMDLQVRRRLLFG